MQNPLTALLERSRPRLCACRGLWLAIHKYIGLTAGALFILSGLTGSLLAFGPEIDAWLNGALMSVEVPAAAKEKPLADILAAAKAAVLPGGELDPMIFFPRRPGACFKLTYSMPSGQNGSRTYEIFVNPFTGTLTGQRLASDTSNPFAGSFMNVVASLHYTLLLGNRGETIMGFAALFLIGSLLSGLILFWPGPGGWRQAFAVKWGATKERVLYDLHRVTGACAVVLLAVTLVTGLSLIFSTQARMLVALFSPVALNRLPALKSDWRSAKHPLGPDAVAAIAARAVPDGELTVMTLPDSDDGVYVISSRAPDEVNVTDAQRKLVIEQYSGKILFMQDPHRLTAGEKVLEWLYPLHRGEAFGAAGRAVILALGLVPLLLYVTGFLRWRWKRRARSATPP